MNQIEMYLKELYEIEPSLRNNEKQALEIVKTLLGTKPNVEVSPEFKQKLKMQLIAEIQKRKSQRFDVANFFKVSSGIFAGALATYAAFQFFVVPGITPQDSIKLPTVGEKSMSGEALESNTMPEPFSEGSQTQEKTKSIIADEKPQKINAPEVQQQKDAYAQKSQTSSTHQQDTPPLPENNTQISQQKQVSPDQNVSQKTQQTSPVEDTSVTDTISSIMEQEPRQSSPRSGGSFVSPEQNVSDTGDTIGPETPAQMSDMVGALKATSFAPQVQYSYVYSGNMIPSYEEKEKVYKVERQVFEQEQVKKVQEQVGEKYEVYNDSYSQTLSISKKYNPEEGYEYKQLTKEDMLSKEEVENISAQFLEKIEVDTKQYAKPVIPYDWEKELEKTQDVKNFYYPENVSLVYPEALNGVPVKDENGYPIGLNVSVDVQKKSVTYAGPIQKVEYREEEKQTLSNTQVLEALKNKGTFSETPEGIEKQEVEVGKAKLTYTKLYSFEGKDQEVIVPSIEFEVLKKPDQYYGPDTIVVPIVK